MMKLKEEQIKEIRELREKGDSSYKIANLFGVSQSTILYHCDDRHKSRVSYSLRGDYIKEYQNKRYKEDESFREMKKKKAKEYKLNKKMEIIKE